MVWDAKAKLPKIIGVISACLPEALMVNQGVTPPVVAYEIDAAVSALRRHENATKVKQ